MAIINTGISQGVELKATEGGQTFIADKSLTKLGSFHITQQLLIGAFGGLLIGAILKG